MPSFSLRYAIPAFADLRVGVILLRSQDHQWTNGAGNGGCRAGGVEEPRTNERDRKGGGDATTPSLTVLEMAGCDRPALLVAIARRVISRAGRSRGRLGIDVRSRIDRRDAGAVAGRPVRPLGRAVPLRSGAAAAVHDEGGLLRRVARGPWPLGVRDAAPATAHRRQLLPLAAIPGSGPRAP